MTEISGLGGTPLVVCVGNVVYGVIYLKDTVKPGLVERFDRLRQIGIKTIMCTGDSLITRGSLTTFSIANDVAKYFAIIPAMFTLVIPQMEILNIMHLSTPYSAILSALIFNAIIIPCLIPIAMRGVKYKPMSSEKMLLKNMGIYGVGGLILPFIGIKIIDIIVTPLLALIGL